MKSFIAVLLAAVAAAQPDSGSPRAIKYAAAQAKFDVENGSLTIIKPSLGQGKDAFSTPESVFYDKAQDISFISNIVLPHDSFAKNGFISTLDANNKLTLKWATEKLNAPKGLYVAGDTLWVTDINEVKSFNAKTGKFLTTTLVKGAEFLNDITVNEAGDVFVTDSGLNGKGKTSGGGKDAIYKISKGVVSTVVKNKLLAAPNGIYQDGDGFVVTSFLDKGVYRVSADGKISDDTTVAGEIDGIEKVKDEYLVSSWVPKTGETKGVSFRTATSGTIMRGKVGGTWRVEVDGLHAPADIGYNSKKNELLIPMFLTNEVRIYSLNDWASKRRGCSRACKKAADVAFAKKDGEDETMAWKECNQDCVAKHAGASILALGAATFLTVAAALF